MPATMRSIWRAVAPPAASSHSRSVSSSATRVSSPAADQQSSPVRSAPASSGSSSGALATRKRSRASRLVQPQWRSTYSAKLANPSDSWTRRV